jgi:predicted enzyme related to lactoylglutathione lyase
MTNTKTANPVTWFEIATSNPDSAMSFYRDLFGWSFTDDEHAGAEYRMIDTGTELGIRGGLRDSKGLSPDHAVFYVQVDDVAAACIRAEELGGKVLLPTSEGGGGVVFAYLLDAVGNHIGVFSEPTS